MPMKNMKTAVIIPSYNESYYLEKCLQSLLNQSVPIGEIIVVDNNSSDNSIKLAKQAFEGRVTFLHEPRQGHVYARNTGFAHAKDADILLRVDADTSVTLTWHETILDEFRIHSPDAWTGTVDTLEANERVRWLVRLVFNSFGFRVISFCSGNPTIYGANMAIKNDMWKQIQPYVLMRSDILEDIDISILISKRGGSIYTNRDTIANVSMRSAYPSISNIIKRLLGISRTYWLHRKYGSVLLSIPVSILIFIATISVRPFASINMVKRHRPNQAQY